MHLKSYSLSLLLAAALLAIPTTANAQNLTPYLDGNSSDAVSVENPETLVSRENGGIVLSQSEIVEIVESGLVACAVNPNDPDDPDQRWTTANGWFRLFDLSEVDEIVDGFTVTSADVGVGGVSYYDPEWPTVTAELRFYTVEGDFTLENSTLIGSVPIEMTEDLDLTVPNVEVTGVSVPAGSQLAVEFYVPEECYELSEDGSEIVAGGCDIRGGNNTFGETAPTYIWSYESCASVISDITDVADIGFATSTWVLAVTGTNAPVANEGGVVPESLDMSLYPNPTADTARLDLQLDSPERVVVKVFDVTGREVATLHEGPIAGQISLELDSSRFTNGTYIVQLRGESFSVTQKFFVLQ